nr:hypothetical protein [Actinomycetota bacterium]
MRAAALAVTAGAGLVTDPIGAVTALPTGMVAAVTDVVAELVGAPPSRRSWRGRSSCWIEVRTLSDDDAGSDLGEAVLR